MTVSKAARLRALADENQCLKTLLVWVFTRYCNFCLLIQ